MNETDFVKVASVVFINPGTGPIRGSRKRSAERNMRQLLIDAKAPRATRALFCEKCDDGRYEFVVVLGSRACSVLMPGLPLARVRYLGRPQDILDFPRLYVDGSSWVWCIAASNIHDALMRDEDA